MAVLALTSASGSPGVTTTAVAMALMWPRPVLLVEADPSGGSAISAGYLRGTRHYEAGILDLALSPAISIETIHDVLRPLAGEVSFVAGIRSPNQAGALRDVWGPLASALAEFDAMGQDVIVDAGRLGLAGSPSPILEAADLTLLVCRSWLPSLAAARSWTEAIADSGRSWRHAQALVIGASDPYNAREVAGALGMPVVADLPDDAAAAAVYHRGTAPPRRFESGAYVRGVASAVEAARILMARNHHELAAGVSQ